MKTVKVSSQNQITIPKFIRETLGIKAGDKLIIQAEGEKIQAKPMGKSVIDKLSGSLTVAENKRNVSLDEVMAKTKKRVAEKLTQE